MQNPSISSSSAALYPQNEASVRNFPVNLFGSVMGLSGLALAWRFAHTSLGTPAFVSEAVGVFALLVFGLVASTYLVKLAKYPTAVRQEFNHPVIGNFFGTIVISILLLAAIVEPYAATVAHVMWTAGMLLTFALGFYVVSRLFRGEVDASHAMPAWLIPGVATLDIPATGAHMPMAWAAEINLLAGAIGSVLALLLITMIVSRLVHRDALAPAMTPSLMILVAPFAVGFLAYSNIVGHLDRFAGLLFYFGLFMFAVIAPKVFRRSTPFSAAWWAISFPMAALTSASLRYATFRDDTALWVIAIILLATLTVVLHDANCTIRSERKAIHLT